MCLEKKRYESIETDLMRTKREDWRTPWFQQKIAQAGDGMVIINGMLLYCGSKEAEITVPKGVWSISGAFFENETIEKVVIPEGVTEIGKYAFKDCSSLKEVQLPESLTVIGEDAFSGCEKLQQITIGENVKRIGTCAFFGLQLSERGRIAGRA